MGDAVEPRQPMALRVCQVRGEQVVEGGSLEGIGVVTRPRLSRGLESESGDHFGTSRIMGAGVRHPVGPVAGVLTRSRDGEP